MTKTFDWTEQRTKEAVTLHEQGKSASAIANAIGAPTRNVVIGKLSRMGIKRGLGIPAEAVSVPSLSFRPEHTRPAERAAKVEARRVKSAERAIEAAAKDGAQPARERRKAAPPNTPENQSARREHFQGVADKAMDRFDDLMPQSPRPIRFLDRGRFQCAAPQRGWDDAPVTEKMVCGRPVQIGTSWCPACLAVVAAPSALAAYKTRKLVGDIAA